MRACHGRESTFPLDFFNQQTHPIISTTCVLVNIVDFYCYKVEFTPQSRVRFVAIGIPMMKCKFKESTIYILSTPFIKYIVPAPFKSKQDNVFIELSRLIRQ